MSVESVRRHGQDCAVLAWRGCAKSTLWGLVDVRLPTGLVLGELTLHRKGSRRWIGMLARPMVLRVLDEHLRGAA